MRRRHAENLNLIHYGTTAAITLNKIYNVLYVETLKTIKIWLKQLIILLRTQIAKNLI